MKDLFKNLIAIDNLFLFNFIQCYTVWHILKCIIPFYLQINRLLKIFHQKLKKSVLKNIFLKHEQRSDHKEEVVGKGEGVIEEKEPYPKVNLRN